MKRLNSLVRGTLVCAVVGGCALVAWHPSRPTFAGEKQSGKPAEWERVTFESGRVKGDVLVFRAWKSAPSDPKWPQLALLRMPPAIYKEFRNDTKVFKAFIDGTNTGKLVFDAAVTITEGCKLPEPGDEKSGEISWLVTIDHRQSRCSCTAFSEQAIVK
jgi:hypothetical protein